MKAKRGFTLVEILIVVVILGILAAIVIPQFTEASTEAKVSRVGSDLQMMRSQLELYKVQHNDNLPAVADFNDAMTKCSAVDTATGEYVEPADADRAVTPFGPYMQKIPTNPYTGCHGVGAEGDGIGWIYDDVAGSILISGDGNNNDIPDDQEEAAEEEG